MSKQRATLKPTEAGAADAEAVAPDLCRAGGALVAAARDDGTSEPEAESLATGKLSSLTWALENLPEELMARGGMFPAQSVVKLLATSKRVRRLLGRLQRRVPAAMHVKRHATAESVASGLSRVLAWCSVVSLDFCNNRIGAEGVRILAGVIGQCSSLATLNMSCSGIRAEGARRLAGVLG